MLESQSLATVEQEQTASGSKDGSSPNTTMRFKQTTPTLTHYSTCDARGHVDGESQISHKSPSVCHTINAFAFFVDPYEGCTRTKLQTKRESGQQHYLGQLRHI